MYIREYPFHDLHFNNTFSDKFVRFSFVLKLKFSCRNIVILFNERRKSYRSAAEIFIECFHVRKSLSDSTFQFVTDMRWFRGHAEAPRLLRLSPLRADEDVNETSYHFRARSRCRGKSRLKWRRDHLSRCKEEWSTLGDTSHRAIALIPLPFIPVAERVGPIFAKMHRIVLRVARTRVFACRPAVCVAGLESGFHPECGDYESTFRQAKFPSDWLESENRSKLT